MFSRVGPLGATTLRLVISAALLLAGQWPWRGRLTREQAVVVGIYGLSIAGMSVLFYSAIARIPLGVAVSLEFLGPLAVAVHQSRRFTDFIWAALATCGTALLLFWPYAGQRLDAVGAACALGSAACWAGYIVYGGRASASMTAGRVAALGIGVAALATLPLGLSYAREGPFQLQLVPVALVVAALSTAIPYSLEVVVLRALPRKTFGILMSIEPVIGAGYGMAFLNERLGGRAWLAIACIVTACVGTAATSDVPSPDQR
jgi:inner membrane transporter RhtA